MKKLFFLFFLLLPLKSIYAEMTSVDKSDLNEGFYSFKDQTIQGCYDQGISAVIQACLISLSLDKQEAYEAEFNKLFKKITAAREDFFDFTLFTRLIKKSKRAWDKNIKDECLAEATISEKDGFGYHNSYNQCLTEAYEIRAKFYQDYPKKIPGLDGYGDKVDDKK